MNLAIGNPTVYFGRRLKLQYVSLAAGLALAAGAALANGGWHDANARQAPRQSESAAGLLISPTHDTPSQVYYLVSTQAQADWASDAENEAALERAPMSREPSRRVFVLKASTEAEERAALELIETNLTAYGPAVVVSVTDLRRP